MTKILVAYRANDLFETYVPKMVTFLKEKGVEVVERVYPREEDKKSLRKDLDSWLNSNADSFTHVLSDETCSRGGVLYDLLSKSKIKELEDERQRSITLDGLCQDGIAKVFFTEEPEHGRDYADLAQAKAIFQRAARAVADKIGSPDAVSIFTGSLGDHQPFRRDPELAVRSLSEWIKEIFPTCKVVVDDYSGGRTWYIRDRHTREQAGVFGESLAFNLPVSTMVDELGKLSLLSNVTEETWLVMAKKLEDALESEGTGAG